MEIQLRSEINVTPLVDVCLVLLIIFMAVTPMLRQGDVKLPRTRVPQALPEKPRQFVVSMQADGTLLVQQKRVAEADLANVLQQADAREKTEAAVVRADRRLRYEQVRRLMKRMSEAGWTRVGLLTERREGST